MVADEQTHEVPDDPAQLESFARFCGYRRYGDVLAGADRAPGDGAEALRGAVRGRARADLRRRQHGVRRAAGRSRHGRGAEGDGLLAALGGAGHHPRLASRPLSRRALAARARAPHRGAAAAGGGARRYRRSRSRTGELRPLHRRAAGGRAAVLAAARQSRPCCGCSPTSWVRRRACRASCRAAGGCSTPCSIRARSARCRRRRSSTG